MQRLRVLCFGAGFFLCALGLSASAACAQEIFSSSVLIERAKELDGREVVYRGEAIGEAMLRGGYGWINIHDGQGAIGVWASSKMLSSIVYTGSYKVIGDWVEVRGVFNRACRAHGADLDIHATEILRIKDGHAIAHRLVPEKKRLVVVFSGVLLCLLILQLLKKALRKK